MAYRRKTRRGNRKRRTIRRRSKKLSKHMVRAIKAIALKPVETKRLFGSSTVAAYLGAAGYVAPSSQAVIRVNFPGTIPRLSNAATNTDTSFIGDSLLMRGLKWRYNGFLSTPVAQPDARMRLTVYQDNSYYAGVTGPGPTDRIFEQLQSTVATDAMWNTQTTKIMWRRSWALPQASIGQGYVKKSFYIPIRRKLTAENDESSSFNTFLGKTKGMQIYWVLEVYTPGGTNLILGVQGVIDTCIYFKDP